MRAACVLVAAMAFASPASAAPTGAPITSDDKALAETLFFAGRGLMDAGRHAEACDKFAESYRLDPAAGTLLNLAVCHRKIGKVASAWGEFRQALADAKKAGRVDRAEFAATQIGELEPQLPYLKIEVPESVRVPGLEIVRNGRVLAPAAWDTELPVDPGSVEIVARAPGHREQKLVLTIQLAEHRTVALPPLQRVAVEPRETMGWSTTRWIGASTFLVGLASGGAAAYFAVRAADAKRESDEECPYFDGERRCTATGVSAMKTANSRAWLSNGGTALAVVGLGVGTYLFIVGGGRAEPRTARVRFDVAATGSGVTGLLSGSFW